MTAFGPRVAAAPFGRIIKEAPEAPYLANAVVLYNFLGRQALNPSGRRQPVPDRTLGAQGAGPAAPRALAAKPRQPSGVHPPAVSDAIKNSPAGSFFIAAISLFS